MSQWTYRDTKEHPILRVTRLIEASNNISNGESISKDLVIRRRSKLDINTREKSKIKNEKSHFVQKVHMIDIEKKGCTSVIRFIHFYIVIWFNVFETTIWQVLFISMRHTYPSSSSIGNIDDLLHKRRPRLSSTNHTQQQCISFIELHKTYTCLGESFYVMCSVLFNYVCISLLWQYNSFQEHTWLQFMFNTTPVYTTLIPPKY